MPITSVATQSSQAASARTSLSDNYDTFLVLLTAQLQNQDPLSPMDSAQFTQQLVQFSQVEQQIRTNEQLEGLVAQYQAASAGAALSYLGRDAIIQANETYLAGGEANWAYRLPTGAEEVTLRVRDLNGRTIYTAAGELSQGEHLFSWDGDTDAGGTAPDGVYVLSIEAKGENGAAMAASVTVRETILGVDFSGATPLVITPTGTRGLETIRSVLDNG